MSLPIVFNGPPPSEDAENAVVGAARIGRDLPGFSFEMCVTPEIRAIGTFILAEQPQCIALVAPPRATPEQIAKRLGLGTDWADRIADAFAQQPTQDEANAACQVLVDTWRLQGLINSGDLLVSVGEQLTLEGRGLASRSSVYDRLASAFDLVGGVHATLSFLTSPKPQFLSGQGVLVHLLTFEIRCLAAAHENHAVAAEARGDLDTATRFQDRAAQLRALAGEALA